MASPFQRYQSGIEASTGNLVQASGQMAAMTANTIAGFGQNLAQGLQQYNENSAKNDILTSEAEALGQQIQQFAAQFGDSPEHKPFADSLQPYIQQLAKVPSQSLTQKMGTVTGVKAAFANVGQQLQVFELMRKERMARDINAARGGVREFDEQTVPTAIIPSGKLPYFYNKNYTEQEGELVRLANEAKARGASVDLPSVLDNWRKGLKANAMSRPDLPPQVKEALVKQIDAGEGLTENIQTDESGVTDYAKEAEMYDKASTSVKEQLAPPKAKAPVDKGTPPAGGATGTTKESKPVSTEEAQAAGKKAVTLENDIRALFGTRKNLEPYEQKKKDKMLAEVKALRETAASAEDAQVELKKVDAQIKAIDESIERGETLEPSFWSRIGDSLTKWRIESQIDNSKEFASEAIIRSGIKITPENVKEFLNKNPDAIKGTSFPTGELRRITTKERQIIDSGIYPVLSKLETKLYTTKSTDPLDIRRSLEGKKTELENRVATGIVNAKPSDISKAQQAAKPAEAKAEPEYALTNQYNMAIGTTTASVATSLESKRNDMKTFFQKKYGYVPASFEESFKATYPEANFKTMETPYGAFMYDGKDWKQIQMQQVKPPSRKELAEEKAVSFGKLQSDSSIDVNEFGELVPNSGVYVRGIFAGSPTDASKFRTQMLEGSNAKRAVGRLIEINDMVGESMPWNSSLWGEAKALLPQIKAGLRTDIIGVGTVSNYEQQLIEEVVANPTLFWSLESSDRAKLAVIMDKISNKLIQEPANFGLEVKVAGRPNAEMERKIKMGNAGKSKLELDFEARGGKKGVGLNWNLTNKIPDALKN
jgi:hypothetical protein